MMSAAPIFQPANRSGTPLSPLIALLGTTPNIGTTTAAFALAYRLAEMTGLKIGYLCLHLKSAKLHRYVGVDEPLLTLDKLRPELVTQSLAPSRLDAAMYLMPSRKNLRVLFGNLMRDHAEYYLPAEIEHLLETARSCCDIVIADAGAYWDNAATITAAKQADMRIVATTPALSHFQEDGSRWLGQIAPLFGLDERLFELLVIRTSSGNGGFHMKQISKEMKMTGIGQLKLPPSMFSALDSGSYDRWLRETEDGRHAMKGCAEHVIKQQRIVPIAPRLATQPWYRKLLVHRSGAGS